ncbi:4Fe-4S binding protein [Puia sp. P3]|uniref:4Fe-4S binding protein n=1 Tax=Puia sp. P3 TaxID=3423952 RepID=UPI003D67B966
MDGAEDRQEGGKHFVFYLVSFIIANTFLAYIIGVRQLRAIVTGPVTEHIPGLLSILGFAGVFYAVYAFFREQACTVVCPYGRLQSVLLDRNSMIVAYDYKRGEPRGSSPRRGIARSGTVSTVCSALRFAPRE